MGKSLKININNNYLSIKKNKGEKIVILVLSIFAASFFYFILFKNISAVKDPDKTKYAIILLCLISLIFLIMLTLSIRRFLMDKDYNIEIDNERVFVNGFEKFQKNKIVVFVEDNVNRWGTKTYEVSLKDDNHAIVIVSGINKIDKEILVNNLRNFFFPNMPSSS